MDEEEEPVATVVTLDALSASDHFSNFTPSSISGFVVGITSGVVAKETFALIINESFLPAVEMIVVEFG